LNISPLDVRNQVFRKKFRGCDPEEVKTFLDAVADYMEEMLKEKEILEKGNSMLQERVDSYAEIESALKDTLVTAQKIGDEARASAQRDAEHVLKEAELEVERKVSHATRQMEDIARNREHLKVQTRALIVRLRGLVEAQLSFINSIEKETCEEQSPDEKGVEVCEDVGP
jgi:cell division initiation protein